MTTQPPDAPENRNHRDPEGNMSKLLKTEELGLFLFSLLLFVELPYAWWLFPLLFLAPDLGMIGYAISPAVGAITYNTTHHKGIAVAFLALGYWAGMPWLSLVGVIMLGHSSFDRILGYGLKYPDSFHHTHLGWIGRQP